MRSQRTALLASLAEWGGAYGILVGKPERKKPFGRPRRKRKDNNQLNLQEIE